MQEHPGQPTGILINNLLALLLDVCFGSDVFTGKIRFTCQQGSATAARMFRFPLKNLKYFAPVGLALELAMFCLLHVSFWVSEEFALV